MKTKFSLASILSSHAKIRLTESFLQEFESTEFSNEEGPDESSNLAIDCSDTEEQGFDVVRYVNQLDGDESDDEDELPSESVGIASDSEEENCSQTCDSSVQNPDENMETSSDKENDKGECVGYDGERERSEDEEMDDDDREFLDDESEAQKENMSHLALLNARRYDDDELVLNRLRFLHNKLSLI